MSGCGYGCGYGQLPTCDRESLSSLKIVKKKVFVDERWSQNRNVTAMDWSSHVSMGDKYCQHTDILSLSLPSSSPSLPPFPHLLLSFLPPSLPTSFLLLAPPSTQNCCWCPTTLTLTSHMTLMEWLSCGTSSSRRTHLTTSSTAR